MQGIGSAKFRKLFGGDTDLRPDLLKEVRQRATTRLNKVSDLILNILEDVREFLCADPYALRGEREFLKPLDADPCEGTETVDFFAVVCGFL